MSYLNIQILFVYNHTKGMPKDPFFACLIMVCYCSTPLSVEEQTSAHLLARFTHAWQNHQVLQVPHYYYISTHTHHNIALATTAHAHDTCHICVSAVHIFGGPPHLHLDTTNTATCRFTCTYDDDCALYSDLAK